MTRATRTFARIGATIAATWAGAAPAASVGEYDGSFSEIVSDGGPCDQVFAVSDYHVKHYLVGPTHRTSVMNFTSATDGAFYHGINFVGLLGGSNDLYYEKQLQIAEGTLQILAEGFVDRAVVYLEFTVDGRQHDGQPLCTASATFGGFN